MDDKVNNYSQKIMDKVQQLLEINNKLTALHWISAQIAAEQDINTMYNLIINGFSEITGVPKCGFYLVDENLQFKELNTREKGSSEPFWLCSGVMSVFRRVLRERVAVITLDQRYCGTCKEKCGSMRLQICALYSRDGTPKGLLVAYDFSNDQFNDEWIKILELYTLQVSLALENAILNSQLRDLAIKDGLTGLYNHRCLMYDLERVILRSEKKKSSCCLMLLDIDDFKKYNDSFGHPAGDYVLKTLAVIMKNSVNKQGIVYRYGGEEFAVLLPDNTLKHGCKIAEKIRQNIAGYDFKYRQITVSIGVAEFPRHAQQLNRLVECADRALYLAKNSGKNVVCFPQNCNQNSCD
ncbi:diguanylate cyclase (GGDEF)-like protein [Desulfohalotomaculum tongense]|uniref:sensor domain-containing diguanylate cyclase n=1 Tax=Desulforadius tongensis TaxID=1216062 RepID=UPI001956071F|nr:diguanylate cyclase [Desulforadius tongensis]MBM7856007.1 diguanylate cyclase (GGDEF)-like protein [Desulforadius tongensis]